MSLEGADYAFGGVATVDVGGNKLEFATPFFFDEDLIGLAGFAVEYL